MNSTRVQPSGVVLPELRERETGEYGDAFARGWKAYEREYKRLNSSPVSAGGVDERAALSADNYISMAKEAFGRVVDHDLRGNPITDYDVLLGGAYGPAVKRLIELAMSRATLSAPSHGEQVQVEAVAVTREDEDGGLYLDWLLEGGISALEFEGQLLLVAHGKVTDESGHGCVIAATPSAGSQGGDV